MWSTGGDRVVLERDERSDLAVRMPPRRGSLRGFGPPHSVRQLDYFHGELSAADAERRLAEPGAFLLRRDPPDSALVLSVCANDGSARHVLMPRAREGGFHLPKGPRVETEEEFVNYYSSYGVPLLGDACLLTPVVRDPGRQFGQREQAEALSPGAVSDADTLSDSDVFRRCTDAN